MRRNPKELKKYIHIAQNDSSRRGGGTNVMPSKSGFEDFNGFSRSPPLSGSPGSDRGGWGSTPTCSQSRSSQGHGGTPFAAVQCYLPIGDVWERARGVLMLAHEPLANRSHVHCCAVRQRSLCGPWVPRSRLPTAVDHDGVAVKGAGVRDDSVARLGSMCSLGAVGASVARRWRCITPRRVQEWGATRARLQGGSSSPRGGLRRR